MNRGSSGLIVPLLAAGALITAARPAQADITSATVAANVLTVTANGDNDAITLRLAAGNVNQLEVLENGVLFTTVDRATFNTIIVDGGAGNDAILISDENGAFTDTETTTLRGGAGDDTLTGGAGGETLEGGADNDTLNGLGGIDTLRGEAGNDTLTGGPGNDPHIGGPGNDLMIWRPGDGNDLIEGEGDVDTLQFDGSNGDEIMTVTANAPRVTFFRNLGNITMDIGTTENLVVNALGGADTITAGAGLAELITITINGGDGNDTITGGDGADTLNGDAGDDVIVGGAGVDVLNGGPGNDTLTGGPGNDPHIGGPGDDLMIWRPGDGNDTNDGEDGTDTLQFDGANAAEIMSASPNGARVTFLRNLGNIVMDIGTTERLVVNGLGGNDEITVHANLTPLITTIIDAGAGADLIKTTASSLTSIVGGSEVDTLEFDAEAAQVLVLPDSISIAGTPRVTHTQVEIVNVINSVTAPPTISITSPTAEPTLTFAQPFINLAGVAADDSGIASITWTNDRGGAGTATGTTEWTAPDIPLQPGANVITVTVQDVSGNRASDVLTVTVEAFTYTLAEGATGTFFNTDILLANPNTVPAPVQITYLKGDGTTVLQDLTLSPTSRVTIAVDTLAGLESAEVSATVTSTAALPIVVERTMTWDAQGYGAHTDKATGEPALKWYFAEGSQGFFETFLLLANPGATPNTATVEYLLENGTPVVKTYDLAPTSRRTIVGAEVPEIVGQSFGMTVTFTQPGMAERAMYFENPQRPAFDAGHESAGVTEPSRTWYLAEGATGSFFTTFLLIVNPTDTDGNATVTYLPADGVPVTKAWPVPAKRRVTINIATEDASLASASVASRVESTVPVLVERAQYWPFTPDRWYEAHNSFGATSLSAKWGLAEGRVGGPSAYQTYILLANTNPSETAQVRITYLRANGSTVVKTYDVNPSTRFNVHVNSLVPELANESFGAVIEVVNGVRIAVERALYSDALGETWAAGTNALATRLP